MSFDSVYAAANDANADGSFLGASIQDLITSIRAYKGGEGFSRNVPLCFGTCGPFEANSQGVIHVSGRCYFCRVTVPRKGTIHDLSAYIAVQSGNISAAIYDTGNATPSPATYTQLWTTGAISCPAVGWDILGDPGLSVVEGQQLVFALSADNATVQFANKGIGHSGVLPSSFGTDGGGGNPFFVSSIINASSHPAPATALHSAMSGTSTLPSLIARIA